MSYNILVVEDDVYIQELIKEFLIAQDYNVDVVEEGIDAWNSINNKNYDLVLLDIMLPNIDGFSLCRMIRQKSLVPVIIITALSEEKDQLKAFDLEVDDFITKPFSFNVLVKRVEAVLRRSKQVDGDKDNCIKFEKLKLDTNGYKVFLDEKLIDLTLKEFEILQVFIENKGRVMTREMLLDKVWGYDYFGEDRIVDAHIKNIRKKIGVPYIKTIKGIGYALERNGYDS